MAAHASSYGALRIEVMRTSVACAALFRPSPRRAGVLSVHRHVVNLLLDGALYALSDETPGGLPNGLEIRDFDRVRDSLRAGIRRDIAAAMGPGATIWVPQLPCFGVPFDLPARRRALGSAIGRLPAVGLLPLLGAQPAVGSGGSIAGATVAAARDPFDRLRASLALDDLVGAADAGAMLVGLGVGQTPSGDDLLVGFTAALTAAGHQMGRPLAAEWAAAAEHGTGLVARTFHCYAAAGEYSERIHRLLASILAGPIDGIDTAVRDAADWGATSGGDTLVGVFAALSEIRA